MTTIVLAIKSFDKTNPVGSYSIGTIISSTAIGAYHRPNSNADELGTSGQIQITQFVSNLITGTFFFTTLP